MFIIVTAAGCDKRQLLANLQEAVRNVEAEMENQCGPANMLAADFEFQVYDDRDLRYMAEFVREGF